MEQEESIYSHFKFSKYLDQIKNSEPIKYIGHVCTVKGLEILSKGPCAKIGEICTIKKSDGTEVLSEVVGLNENIVKLTVYGLTDGIEIGCEVIASGETLKVPVGYSLLGRTINAVGKPCDNLGEIIPETYYPAVQIAPDAMTKLEINKRITTGVRAIDSMLTIGKGQRIGIFAGSGVGKSTIMGMIARNTNADINVIGLIGERGREVLDFINRDLGPEGMKRSVVVVAKGDEPAICKMRAAQVCTAVAEFFRDKGKDVMLMMDNVTRFAKAQGEICLSSGEAPAQRGYPSSVFDSIPKLLERTGTNDKGSITAFYAVLVDGDDMDEPISDCVRGVLDGHIVLSRKLASNFHYPAIDVLQSISRLSRRVTGEKTRLAVGKIRTLMSVYQTNAVMINSGIYQKGTSPSIDEAISKHEQIEEFLKQKEYEKVTMEDTLKSLSILSEIEIPLEEYSETPCLVQKKYEMPKDQDEFEKTAINFDQTVPAIK
ncbi:MAG: FliI/YscN family ATPase [Spirochaetia bacterium]|nr:FliI/YscN family ATPase [Spirochaetia bacterium]MDD5777230.1 FliI/YscN family ATPase [Treponema sp.]MCI5608357.1 FliI/YscN family ATPase [Spirochaetia bacterium]MCI6826670.1 FliI/YscN family ATPase [Spirochaetia bacterium]MCI7109625.1 FliI/YscN family ATPase [Spirochaetia bacterium]